VTNKTLGSLQVAALLVSASYGIGFLFGSGELAIAHGMAGGIYGVATGIGMLVLAGFARSLWAAGLPVWDLFGRAYGERLQRVVALLSLVWMAGVLAAQIHGGLAVARLLGLVDPLGHVVVLALIYGASRLDLRFASGVFGLCLLASALVLVYALFEVKGISVYAQAVPTFMRDLSTFSMSRVLAISLAVGLLVCTGADYHQFVLAARGPWAATFGCVLAGLALLVIGFLPPAVVVSMQHANALKAIADGKQVVPSVLSQVAASLGPGAETGMLVALSMAALGSAAAILRAMASALASATPGRRTTTHPAFAGASLAVGAALAMRDQGIVDTMVSVNVIYISSIGTCFAALLAGTPMPPARATAVMAAGFSVSLAVYVFAWAGWKPGDADVVSLASGLGASVATWAWLACRSPVSDQTSGRSR
jgi:solute:Na+ symporter, SSS family